MDGFKYIAQSLQVNLCSQNPPKCGLFVLPPGVHEDMHEAIIEAIPSSK